jgi:hypothetical protein
MTKSLSQYLTECLSKPFKWGEHDCTLFVSNWIKISSGIDFLDDVPKWNSVREAKKLLEAYGGLEKACDEKFKRISVNQARDGDVGMVGESLCLFVGSRVVATGMDGLVYQDRGEAKCAWQYY